MKLIQFIFSFLYTRNWVTGHMELSRPRVMLFASMLFLIFLGLLIAGFLKMPMVYTSATL